ncbi:MAG: urate hydroxylase PuuD [Gammaproteobacteria bacterium]|nr:MAG: urate hydroxylase PuuD [Gammaproteobacteria bacterium]
MSAYLFDIASLLGRWLHLITGIAWIGASFYFVWLDNHLLPPRRKELIDAGVGGEVWAVHGGGFYNAQKYKTAPQALPETLHWFYWEAYTTWLSGMFLLCLIYFGQAQAYLIDPAVMPLSQTTAIGIALALLALGWIVYDLLCRSPLGRDDRALGAVIFALLGAAAWGLCHLYSGRGAYILFGAIIGTIMVANVFFVIIPGQREMVNAKREGRPLDPVYGLRGKQRSVHNTYFTLPVLFVMISNHYALTYGAKYNWLVLIAMAFAGAAIRAWFVARHKAHERGGKTPLLPLALGLLTLAGVIIALAPRSGDAAKAVAASSAPQRFANVQGIINARCVPCHAVKPTYAGFPAAPNGVLLDTPESILARAAQMQTQLSTRVMPIGNLTKMTDEERALVLAWLAEGAPH